MHQSKVSGNNPGSKSRKDIRQKWVASQFLDSKDELFLTLMKLRLSLTHRDLAGQQAKCQLFQEY